MRYLMFTLSLCLLQGCAVKAVADFPLATAATVAKAGVKTVGAAVDLVTPYESEQEKEKNGEQVIISYTITLDYIDAHAVPVITLL